MNINDLISILASCALAGIGVYFSIKSGRFDHKNAKF